MKLLTQLLSSGLVSAVPVRSSDRMYRVFVVCQYSHALTSFPGLNYLRAADVDVDSFVDAL